MEIREKNSEREDRLAKLAKIKEQNINPYPADSQRDILVAEILEKFDSLASEAKVITVGGRLKSWREHGNISFANLVDHTGQIQLVFSKNDLGDTYKQLLKLIDSGDFLEASGICFTTNAGEKSLQIKNWRLLTKALRGMPDEHYGLKNEEERLRKRYLDIIMHPEVHEMVIKRSKFWSATRDFLRKNSFLEVETPILENMPGGAEARPFITHHNALDIDIYLRIAPELWLKRLMVAGLPKVFEIGRVFRNEGMDAEHAQDYTVMEFYWAYADYNDGMKFVEEMYKYIAQETFGTLKFQAKGFEIDLAKQWETYNFVAIIQEKTGIDIFKTTLAEAENKLRELGVEYDSKGMNLTRAIDNLWKFCRKQIAGPGFLINVPVFMEPLAKRSRDNSELVERFQIILAGSEMGKGFSELNDPVDQAGRFDDQAKLREEGDDEAQMNDTDFVEALEYGMPPTCGFGFSERLFSFLMDKPIRECQIFPLMRPKNAPVIIPKKEIVLEKEIIAEEPVNTRTGFTYAEAKEILHKYVTDHIILAHSLETEAIMRALAIELGQNEEDWGIVGLLHDIDWQLTKDKPLDHCVKAIEILQKEGGSQFLINSIISHTYGHPDCAYSTLRRSKAIEHALAAAETVSGLIVASALIRPDKAIAGLEPASLLKKFNNKAFAAKCDREIIKEIELVNINLDKFLGLALEALKKIAPKLGL